MVHAADNGVEQRAVQTSPLEHPMAAIAVPLEQPAAAIAVDGEKDNIGASKITN